MEVGKKVLYDRIEQRELPKRFQLCYCFFAFVTRFFTFISLFFPLLLLSLDGFCQPEGELGILGGMGYYMGEYNPNRHFDRSQRYLGGFCRYNLNDRFALRLFFENRYPGEILAVQRGDGISGWISLYGEGCCCMDRI